jgi:hypothetical protein
MPGINWRALLGGEVGGPPLVGTGVVIQHREEGVRVSGGPGMAHGGTVPRPFSKFWFGSEQGGGCGRAGAQYIRLIITLGLGLAVIWLEGPRQQGKEGGGG